MRRLKIESALFHVPDEAPPSSHAPTTVTGLNRRNRGKSLLMGAGLLLVGLLPSAANAATKTWDGGSTTTNNWTDGVNWDNDTAPVAGDSLVFAGTTRLAPVNDFAANTQFNGISFSATAGAFVITGNPINMGGDLSDSSTAVETLRIPMTLLQNETVTVNTGGSLMVNTVVATFTSTLAATGGTVSAVNITNGGSGYAPNASLPLTFTAAPTGGTTATGTANTNANGVVTSVTITNAGAGYLVAPTVTLGALSTIFSQVQDATPATPRSLTKIGAGTLTLGSGTFVNGAGMINTYTGGTIVNAGTLVLSPPSSIGTGVIRGQLDINAGATVNLTSNDNALGFTTTPAGAATVKVETVNINGGTLNTTAANNGVRTNFNLTGGTMGGTGAFNIDSSLGFAITTLPSATPSTITNIALRSAAVIFNVPTGADLNVTGVISGNPVTSGLNKLGAGTLFLGGSSTFTGTTTVTAGLVQLSASNRLADTSGLTFNGGNFATAGFSDTVGALGLSASSTLDLGNGASTLSFAGTTATFTAGATLSIVNYTSGPDHIFINSAAAPTADQLAQISFVTANGNVGAQRLSSNEIVPIGSVTEAFWQGDVDNNWSTNNGGNTNWATDATGTTDLGRLPGAGDNVTFATTNATNLPATVLGADFSIRSLIVNTTTGLTVGGTNSLTIGSAGISVAAGAGSVALNNSSVVLGGDQNWANNNAAGGNALTVSSAVSGTGGIIKTGTGPLNLSGNNSFNGATTINAGILTVSGGNAIPDTSAVVTANIAGVSLNVGATETVGSLSGGGTVGGGITLGANNLAFNGAGATFAGIISGTGSLTKVGTGTQTLSAANTLTGTLTVNGGTLTLSGLNLITTTTVNGGTLNLSVGGAAGAIRGTLNINNGTTVNLTVENALGFTLTTGTNATVKVDTVNINGGTLNNAFNGNNGVRTNFNLTGGTMSATGGGAISLFNIESPFSITTLPSATTSLISGNVLLRSPAGTTNPVPFNIGQGTTPSGIDLNVTGVLSGGVGFSKTGTGTLVLNGNNTYTGVTTVGAGRLQLGAADRINNGSAIVLSGSTFATGGFNEQVGALTLTDATASFVDLGAGTSVLRFGSLAAGAGTLSVLNYTAGTDQLFIGTTGALTTAQLAQISFNIGGSTVAAFQRSTGEVVPAINSAATTGAIINEFRSSGPSGPNDEFIELFNTTGSSLDVGGWSVVVGGVTITIPAGFAPIPYRGHLLLVNNATGGYSLANYGGTNAASGDVFYATDIADATALSLRNASNTVVDTVNPGALPAPLATTDNYSYVRRLDSALPQDTDSDAADFNLVDVQSTVGPDNTTGVSSGIIRLGAPGPENLRNPVVNNSLFIVTIPANAVTRTGTGNSGNLTVRRTLTVSSTSGKTVTALRVRVVGLTAGTAATATTAADIRLVSSTSADGINLPLLLQEPPTQPTGGGLNASLSLSGLPAGGVTPGNSVTFELNFAVSRPGTYRFLLNVEPVTTP